MKNFMKLYVFSTLGVLLFFIFFTLTGIVSFTYIVGSVCVATVLVFIAGFPLKKTWQYAFLALIPFTGVLAGYSLEHFIYPMAFFAATLFLIWLIEGRSYEIGFSFAVLLFFSGSLLERALVSHHVETYGTFVGYGIFAIGILWSFANYLAHNDPSRAKNHLYRLVILGAAAVFGGFSLTAGTELSVVGKGAPIIVTMIGFLAFSLATFTYLQWHAKQPTPSNVRVL